MRSSSPPNGQLIAHGNPNEKPRVARGDNLDDQPLVRLVHGQRDAGPASLEYANDSGVQMLGVAAPLEPLGWTVMVEQPRSEAYAVADQLTRQLVLHHRPRAARHGQRRLLLRPIVHPPDLRAHARHPRGRRRPARRARHDHLEGRVQAARRRLQQHGRQARRAHRGRPKERAAGDVRPHGRRPRPRPLAPGPEHRQQLQAHRARLRRPRVPPDVHAHDRSRNRHAEARARRPAQRRAARRRSSASRSTSTARSPTSSSRCAASPTNRASRSSRSSPPSRSSSRATSFALGRVYRNLITNAIQATQAGGRVTIATSRDRRQGGGERHRHRLGHPGRAARRDLRRLRHDEEARPRPRAWPSPSASSNSSAARSPSRASSAKARRSRCGFRWRSARRRGGRQPDKHTEEADMISAKARQDRRNRD